MDLDELEVQLRRLLEEVRSPDYPEIAEVRGFLEGHLREAIASVKRNRA